jgi:hypothetical protein
MIERMEVADSDSEPVRSRSMVAIGDSRTGRCEMARPGSAMRKALTQRISDKAARLAERSRDARQQDEADEDIEPRIIEHRIPELAVEDGYQQPDQHQEHEHAPQVQPRREQALVQGRWRPVRRSRSSHESFSASIGATLAKDALITNRQLDAVNRALRRIFRRPAGLQLDQPSAGRSAAADSRPAPAKTSSSALCTT